MTRIAATLLAAAVVLSACQTSKEDTMDLQQRAEERAVITRSYVDDLAQQLGGTAIEVASDDTIECDLADPDEGLSHSYTLRFSVGPEASQLLKGPIAEQMEADGWTVRTDPAGDGEVRLRFLRDTFSIAAAVPEGVAGDAVVLGSGGCVKS